MSKNFNDIFELFRKDKEIENFGRSLGKGAYGEVRDVKMKNFNKMLASKLYKTKDKNDLPGDYLERLRGPNIVKINKILKEKIGDDTYELVIMEKALLRDLGKLSEFYHKHNLLKLIYINAFDEKLGNSLLRYYTRQIVNSFDTLDRNDYVHFDIKPENLLVTINLIVKLSDFSILREIKTKNEFKIPGGTPGFVSPEYYSEKLVSKEDAKKQDYFALGSTLFYLKYGSQMIRFKRSDNLDINNLNVILNLQQNISFINCSKTADQDFINFIQHLIKYAIEERPNFEIIYRDKWLNSNVDIINKVLIINENDEEKAIMEFQKSDFLIKMDKNSNKKQKKFRFKRK